MPATFSQGPLRKILLSWAIIKFNGDQYLCTPSSTSALLWNIACRSKGALQTVNWQLKLKHRVKVDQLCLKWSTNVLTYLCTNLQSSTFSHADPAQTDPIYRRCEDVLHPIAPAIILKKHSSNFPRPIAICCIIHSFTKPGRFVSSSLVPKGSVLVTSRRLIF